MSLLEEARKLAKVSVGQTHGGYLHGVSVVGAASPPPSRLSIGRPTRTQSGSPPPPRAGGASTSSGKARTAASDAAKQANARKVAPRKPNAAAIAKKSPHLRALAKGASSAKRAESAGLRAIQAGSTHKPAATKVQGACVLGALACGHDVYEIVGAASPNLAAMTAKAKSKLSPKQRAAVTRHEAAIAKSNAAAVKAVKAGNASVKAAQDLAAHMKKVSPKVAKLFAWRGAGGLQTVLGFYEIVGDEESSPEDGAPQGGSDPTVPTVYTLETDPNVTPMPVRGKKLPQEDAFATWQKVPEDGIVYDGSRGWPRYTKGSFRSYYGPQKDGVGQFGMIYGYDKMNWPSSKDPRWIRRYGQNGMSPDEIAHAIFNPIYGIARAIGQGNDNWDDGFVSDAVALAQSNKDNAGPLIGNPGGELAGLQYAVADDKWFWQGENAPKWATAEADSAIASANKKIVEADNAAARAEAAAAAKDKADREAEAARQDAEMALAEKQAESDRRVAESQSAAAATRQQSEDAATESALAAAQVKLDQQAAQLQMQAQQQQLAWLQQNGLPPDLGTYGQLSDSSESVDQNGVPKPPVYRGDTDLATQASTPEMPEVSNFSDEGPPPSVADDDEAEVPAFDETEAL